ncbi:TetR/AcrR family transcriptional regulator [Nocardioides sp. cx-173]|uniref:TetR/AcrR family transcriptional regulator n=1 Tax=Nocardioides sp. cx-173 TaxID=2898796 RepID=UPI001E51E6CC|nr:TetR/AcrR family transcriptional regulator [Nocardioides sp. cx-173]MCD4525313.1 TetR/AcrR family transcriptional regulator [Nocardioides sp. cx-173]UGB40889.1 TetR/AcrR family transcriptional regulator [Nocardioides sp. cx-173]
MPRITGATVAEHHAQQRRALLDAARQILAEKGEVPAMGEVGRRAGLARSSVYQYFSSSEDLLAAVVGDAFPDWARQVLDKVASAPTPGTRVWAYVEANIDLFASSELAVAQVLRRIVDPQVLQRPMKDFHVQLQRPLRQALADLGDPEPEAMAEHVDSLVMQASTEIGAAPEDSRPEARLRALARLRRLLSGYLRLE